MKVRVFKGISGYQKLSHLPFNRDFTLRPSLVKSMRKHGFITAIYCCYSEAITGVKELYVLDGQHRALAAQYLDIDFTVCILDYEPATGEDLIDLVSLYNNTAVSWKLETYCKAYAALGKKDYKYLVKMCKINGIAFATFAIMLTGNLDGKNASTACKTGTFKITSKNVALKTLDLSKMLAHKMSGRMLMALHVVRLTRDNFRFDKFRTSFDKNFKNLKSKGYDNYKEEFIEMGT
jgi:hypothetical protein